MAVRKLLIGFMALIVSFHGVAGNPIALSADQVPSTDSLELVEQDFRIQVYRTFRQQRAEFDRRRAVWSRVRTAWQEAGADPQEQAKLIDWLDAATRASTADTLGPLPADPRFGMPPEDIQPEQIVVDPSDGETAPAAEPPDSVPEQPTTFATTPDIAAPARIESTPPLHLERNESSTSGRARVNLAELAASIGGHNFGLRSMETDLLDTPSLDIGELESAVERLEALSTRRGDLSLYYDLLPPDLRSRVEPLSLPRDVIALLGDQISNRRAGLENSASSPRRRSSLAALDRLSRRLAELYSTMNSTEELAP